MVRGITVRLYERTQTGADSLGNPVFAEAPVDVQDVLVAPVAAQDLVNAMQLYGKKATYELSLPKGDAHHWEDCRVDFFGHSWRVFGPPKEWIESMVPGRWNKKVMVERYE